MKAFTAAILLAISITCGCTSWMLTDSTLENMSTAQLRQQLKSAENNPWWFDNKETAKIYAAELERREALDQLASERIQ